MKISFMGNQLSGLIKISKCLSRILGGRTIIYMHFKLHFKFVYNQGFVYMYLRNGSGELAMECCILCILMVCMNA